MDWVERAAEMRFKNGVSWTQLPPLLVKEFGGQFSFHQVRNRLRRHPDYKEPYQKGNVTYENRRINDDASMEGLKSLLVQAQHVMQDDDVRQTSVTITIDDTKPIGIPFLADWHIGGWGVDHEKLFADVDLIAGFDGLHPIHLGDTKDNYRDIKGTPQEQLIRPGKQDSVVLSLMEQLQNMLAVMLGCHDYWDIKDGDKDFISTCAQVSDSVHLWAGGDMFLNLGEQQYHIRARHKYKGESGLNTTNTQRRMTDEMGHADINAVAHKHFWDMQQHIRQGKPTIDLRAGTYKYLDDFGQKLAGYKGMYGIPIVILFPDKKKLVPFTDFMQGLEYLDYLRSNLGEV